MVLKKQEKHLNSQRDNIFVFKGEYTLIKSAYSLFLFYNKFPSHYRGNNKFQ